jgi:NTE family protein
MGAEIVIAVILNTYAVNDFTKAEQIMDRGLEGGEKRKLLLTKFALNENEWTKFQQQRQSRRKTITRAPEFISIDLPDTKLATHLQTYFADQIGKPLEPKLIEAQILKIMGMGVFAHVSYAPIERDGKLGLAIYINRSDSRPPTLRPAMKLDGADYLNTRFALAARLTMSDLGGYRSELRNDILLGSAYGIRTEYFRPFTPLSKWFLAPHAFAENRPMDFYRRSRILAQYRDHTAGGGLDLGYSIGNTAELRVGYEVAYRNTVFRVGDPAIYPDTAGRYGATQISYNFDRVDDNVIPHAGALAEAKFRWVDANPGSPGRFPALEAKATIFQPFGDRLTGFASTEGGTVFDTKQPGLPFYFLGGPMRLSAYGMNELIGNQYFLGRAGVLKQINKSAPLTIGRMYLFGAVEAGKMYGARNATKLPIDATAGFLVRTMLGPLFLGGSIGDAGHRKLFFQLGRFF